MSITPRAHSLYRHAEMPVWQSNGNGQIYLHGNINSSSEPGSSAGAEGFFLERYDIASNSWDVLSPHPSRNIGLAAFMCDSNGRLVIAGGTAYSTTSVSSQFVSAETWAYDPATDSWAQWANLPSNIGRRENYFWVQGGQFYIAGGLEAFVGISRKTLRYSGGPSGTWSDLSAPMNYSHYPTRASHGFACEDSSGRKYAIGGDDGTGIVIASCERWSTNHWETIAPMPTPLADANIAIDPITDEIYITQGTTTSFVVQRHTYRYDPVADAWTQLPDHPRSSIQGVGLVQNGFFYTWPGRVGTQGRELWAYDIAAGEWCRGFEFAQPRHSDHSTYLIPTGTGSYLIRATTYQSSPNSGASNTSLDEWFPESSPCGHTLRYIETDVSSQGTVYQTANASRLHPWGPYETDRAAWWGRATSYSPTFHTAATATIWDNANRIAIAQSFVAAQPVITRVAVSLLFPSGTLPTDDVIVEVLDDLGGFPGIHVLAAASLTFTQARDQIVTGLGLNEGKTIFDFVAPLSVTVGNRYWIAVRESSGTIRASGYGLAFYYNSTGGPTDPYPSEEFCFVGATSSLASTDYRPFTGSRMQMCLWIESPGLYYLGGALSDVTGTGDNGEAEDFPQSTGHGWVRGILNGSGSTSIAGSGAMYAGEWDGLRHYFAWGPSNGSTVEIAVMEPLAMWEDIPYDVGATGTRPAVTTNHNGLRWGQLLKRQDGSCVFVYQGTTETVGGVAKRRVSYKVYDFLTNVWSAEFQFNMGSTHNFTFAQALRDSNDAVHVFWYDTDDVGTTALTSALYHSTIAGTTAGVVSHFADCYSATLRTYPMGLGCQYQGGIAIPYMTITAPLTGNEACLEIAYWPSDLTTSVPTKDEPPTPQPGYVIRAGTGYPCALAANGSTLFMIQPQHDSSTGAADNAVMVAKRSVVWGGLYNWWASGFESTTYGDPTISYIASQDKLALAFIANTGRYFTYFTDPLIYPTWTGCGSVPVPPATNLGLPQVIG
jgi:hypothetical protein